jgi:type I restriction enzyme S subunit
MMRLDVDTEIADPHFVWLWLQTPVVREYIMRNAKGTSPTMKKISQGIVSAVPFPDSLSLTTQSQWVDKLRSISELLTSVRTAQRRTMAEVSALLPSVLDRAFRGEL